MKLSSLDFVVELFCFIFNTVSLQQYYSFPVVVLRKRFAIITIACERFIQNTACPMCLVCLCKHHISITEVVHLRSWTCEGWQIESNRLKWLMLHVTHGIFSLEKKNMNILEILHLRSWNKTRIANWIYNTKMGYVWLEQKKWDRFFKPSKQDTAKMGMTLWLSLPYPRGHDTGMDTKYNSCSSDSSSPQRTIKEETRGKGP